MFQTTKTTTRTRSAELFKVNFDSGSRDLGRVFKCLGNCTTLLGSRKKLRATVRSQKISSFGTQGRQLVLQYVFSRAESSRHFALSQVLLKRQAGRQAEEKRKKERSTESNQASDSLIWLVLSKRAPRIPVTAINQTDTIS